MSRLITISITALVSDDADAEGIADAIMNTASVEAYEEAFNTDVELLESEITLDVAAEE